MKKMLSLFATALFSIQVSYADPVVLPEKCPSISAIAKVGITFVQKLPNGKWLAGNTLDKYDTNQFWGFVIGFIDASNARDAYNKATAAILTLDAPIGPIDAKVFALCGYKGNAGYVAGAVTPTAPSNAESILTLAKQNLS